MTVETTYADGVLTVRRDFTQQVAAVFDAWIDAAKTTHWWGCANTTKVVSDVEPKMGGRYHHTMSITDVGDHMIEGRLIEFTPPKRLVYTMPATHFSPEMTVDVSFEASAAGTTVTLRQSEIDATLKDVVAVGWTASFERLAEFFEGGRRAA